MIESHVRSRIMELKTGHGGSMHSKPVGQLTDSDKRRFWSRVFRTQVGCWIWTGKKEPRGYARFAIKSRKLWAHRVAYSLLRGEVPDGLVIDHLCRNPSCVNPDHLEAVTQGENLRRGHTFRRNLPEGYVFGLRDRVPETQLPAHCRRGHSYGGGNLTISKRGKRTCKTCGRERKRIARSQVTGREPEGGKE